MELQNLRPPLNFFYRCQLNFDVQNTIAKEVDLQVTRPPSILDATDPNIQVVVGQSATLYCKADGFPKPEIIWKRDNDAILFSKIFSTR